MAILLSKYDGVPTTAESANRQWERFTRDYKNHSYWCLSSWHNHCYLVQKIIPSGRYKGLIGVYHYISKPKTKFLKIEKY